MLSKTFVPIFLAMIILMLLGCSGSSVDSPIIPSDGNISDSDPGYVLPGRDEAQADGGTHQLWGYYLFMVSEDHQKITTIPQREITKHFNVLSYLEDSPCNDCVKIVSKEYPGGGIINFGIQLRHPFVGQNLYTGFDVRGIGIFRGSGYFPAHDLKYSLREENDAEILNPDGFTTLYHVATQGSGPEGLQGYKKGSMSSPMAPDASLNAYKNFYSSDNRHFLLAGAVKQVTYSVDPPPGAFAFGYAVDANWAPPQTTPPENIPDDFGLNANSAEAYRISATVGEGLLTDGGSADVEIWIFDWQGFATINSVKLEAPGLFTGLVDADFDSMSGDYVSYSATITNPLTAAEGLYDVLIAVEDTANENAPDYLDLTAYQIVEAEVTLGVPNAPPVAIAEADQVNVGVGEMIHFDGSASYDPEDVTISLFQWDKFGLGDYSIQGTDTPQWSYESEGEYDVDLKVWDSLNLTDVLDEKIHIVVTADPCAGHGPTSNGVVNKDTPNVGEEITFTDISTDPDGFGDLAFFEWDLNGIHDDGPQSDGFENFNKNPLMIYSTGGNYSVYHRTSDNSNCVDEMDDPIIIYVNGPPIADAEADQTDIMVTDIVVFTSLSVDDDGNGPIVTYEWDLDGDGEFTDDMTGPVVQFQYMIPGTVEVLHRVTDDKGLVGEMAVPITINVESAGDVIIHLSEEHAMNPNGAQYVFNNYYGSISGTSLINYLDIDGPWDFTTLGGNGVFYQDVLNKTHPDVSGYNSNWTLAEYYIYQKGPSSLSGATTEGYGAMRRIYNNPPDDGDQLTYGIVDVGSGEIVKFNPYNILTWPLDTSLNQYDSFTYTALSVEIDAEVWAQALGQGTAIIDVEGVATPFQCLLFKTRQRDVWDSEFGPIVLGDTVVYRWMADDGTEIAAVTAMNAYMNPDNWNVGSGLITGTGCIRWLNYYDLGDG